MNYRNPPYEEDSIFIEGKEYARAIMENTMITSSLHSNSEESQEIGRKFDKNKLEYGLLPPLALKATVDVLTFGAQKYERGNWIHVSDAKRRYFDALQRHIWAWKEGEQIDLESEKHHLAHAMCCLMFLYEHDIKYSKNIDD